MYQPTIIIAGAPRWADALIQRVEDEYTIEQQPQPDGYMKSLIESRAVLVLVDGSREDWSKWTSVPKSSPATRRIPIVLVSDDVDIRTMASVQGADLAVTEAELLEGISRLIQDYARLPEPQDIETLRSECAQPLPPRALEAIRMFNEGQYYKQHDLLEEQWMETESPIRDLYRAILQVGVAYYQIERGNYRGALKMLQRSVQWLVLLPDVCQQVNIKKLRDDSFRVREELERLGEARFDEFDHSLIQGVELIL